MNSETKSFLKITFFSGLFFASFNAGCLYLMDGHFNPKLYIANFVGGCLIGAYFWKFGKKKKV